VKNLLTNLCVPTLNLNHNPIAHTYKKLHEKMYYNVHSINKLGKQNLVKYALIKPKWLQL
jgi:hypothetical protein